MKSFIIGRGAKKGYCGDETRVDFWCFFSPVVVLLLLCLNYTRNTFKPVFHKIMYRESYVSTANVDIFCAGLIPCALVISKE